MQKENKQIKIGQNNISTSFQVHKHLNDGQNTQHFLKVKFQIEILNKLLNSFFTNNYLTLHKKLFLETKT